MLTEREVMPMIPILSMESLRMLPRKMMMEAWRRINSVGSTEEPWEPLGDVFEDPNNFYVYIELPGVKKEDVVITLDKDKLVVKGKKITRVSEEDARKVFVESLYGNFEKVIEFGEEIDADKVTAEMQQGVLKVLLPKKSVSTVKRVPVSGE